MNGVSDIAVLKDRVDRHRADLKRVFTRVEGVEETQTQNSLERVRDEAKQEEMGASINSLNHTMEAVIEEVKGNGGKMDKIDSRLQSIETSIKSINDRVTSIERKEIDMVKVIRWLGTWRGTFFMCFVLSITLGVLVPDARDFILEVLGIATKAK